MQYAVELIVTLPLLLLLLRTAPAVRSVSHYSVTVQCQFGCTPALYYAFDYLTRVYTNLLADGDPAVVEFMPFVCCVAYLAFVLRSSAENETRLRLEQTARYAADHGFESFTSTLFVSPYQDHELLRRTAEELAAQYGVAFLYRDFRPGFRQGQQEARELGLYMQKYCGCVFSEEDRYAKQLARDLQAPEKHM